MLGTYDVLFINNNKMSKFSIHNTVLFMYESSVESIWGNIFLHVLEIWDIYSFVYDF